MNEFDLIERYFKPLTQGRAEARGLLSDTAALVVPAGQELIVTSDTLNAGTHFFADMHPGDIARKALRANLSDLAAAGARPYAYQLCIAFPQKPDEAWLEFFSDALLSDQEKFGIFCSGGDTTSIQGPLSISITAMGLAPTGKSLSRVGAQPGDQIVLTGAVGDAVVGLRVLQKKLMTEDDGHFIRAYANPSPRVSVIDVLRDAHAAVDISDGLIGDLGHVCKASDCAARIELSKMHFSGPAEALAGIGGITVQELLTGGDDYEIALAVAPEKTEEFMQHLVQEGLSPQIIGEFTAGSPGVFVFDKNGYEMPIQNAGWTHF